MSQQPPQQQSLRFTSHLPINLEDLLRQRTVELDRIEYKAGWNPESIIRNLCASANDFENLLPIHRDLTAQGTTHVASDSESSGNQVGTKLALSRHQVAILEKCREEMEITALMELAEHRDRTKFRQQVLNPLLAAGLIEMTIPFKPRSSNPE